MIDIIHIQMDSYCNAVANSLNKLIELIDSKQQLMKEYNSTNDKWQAIDSDNENFSLLENKMEMIKIQLTSIDMSIIALSGILKNHDPKEIEKLDGITS